MHQPIRLSIVSYLNSLPLLHGLRSSSLNEKLAISEDHPARCAEKLSSGEADIGLIPVATLKGIKHARIISDYCIGCDGNVDSVLLVSEVPFDQLETVLMDYQSRTSVQLVKVLSLHHWKKSVDFKPATEGYEASISGTTGGVIIGDRALVARHRFNYAYDLGGAWKEFTGLPFVFAVWASVVPIDEQFTTRFNAALKSGIDAIPKLARSTSREFLEHEQIRNYWENKICYAFGEEQKKALAKFLEMIDSDF